MAKINVPTIPHDALIKLEVSGTFYRKITEIFIGFSETIKQEDFKAIMEGLKNNEKPKDITTAQIQLLAMFIHDIEVKAQEQGLVKMQEVEVPDAPAQLS